MNTYHRKIRKQWKRAIQKRKTAENKQAAEVARRLLGEKPRFHLISAEDMVK